LQQALRLDDRALLFVNLVINDIDCLGDLDAAIAKCKTRLSKYGGEVGVYAYMAYAYLGKGDLKEAERAFQSAMGLNALPATQYNFVLTLLLDHQIRRAIEVLNGMVENNQQECPAYYYLGVAHSLVSDPNAARRQWTRAAGCYRNFIRSHPEMAEENIELAITLTRLGETAAASIAARKARPEQTDPDSKSADANFHFDMARLYAVQGMPDEAMHSFERAEQLGFKDYVYAKAHPDLQSLSGNPRFLAMIRRHVKLNAPQ
jgi:tetratricopeptide (TPR) repeat protein